MNAFLEVCTQICVRTREGATKSVGVSREVLGREVRLECILKGLGEAEKRVESMPSIKHGAGKPSEFRETQVVQSVIYSSEGGRRVTRGKKKWREDWKRESGPVMKEEMCLLKIWSLLL